MTQKEALELAIAALREKSEADGVTLKFVSLRPELADTIDRHILARFRTVTEAISVLSDLQRELSK